MNFSCYNSKQSNPKISFAAFFFTSRLAFLRTTWIGYLYIFGKKMERQRFRNGLMIKKEKENTSKYDEAVPKGKCTEKY
jgi:hypothetical protein